MRPERPIPPLAARVRELNVRHAHSGAAAVLRHALTGRGMGRVALVSSFGAESVVLLHLVAQIDRATPVLFLETGMLFPETLEYRSEVVRRLGLGDVRSVRPEPARTARQDPDGRLHRTDPDACCALRKTAPLGAALAGFDAWISGRKRAHGGARTAIEPFEAEPGTGRLKINPLADWSGADIDAHIAAHGLPRHPLVARGYPSIGCAPCTSPVAAGEDARAGRWRGRAKRECGIHIAGGRIARTSHQESTP